MCDKNDFNKVYDKPKYQGDFIRQMFEWNYKSETEATEMALLKESWRNEDTTENESWEDFE